MEAELLAVLGHIPAPDDRDLASQLTTIERSGSLGHLRQLVAIGSRPMTSLCRSKTKELQVCQSQFQKGSSELSRLQAQLEETE